VQLRFLVGVVPVDNLLGMSVDDVKVQRKNETATGFHL